MGMPSFETEESESLVFLFIADDLEFLEATVEFSLCEDESEFF